MGNSTGVAALSLRGVTVAYYDNTALEGVTLEIERGEFVGVVGPNGAGKSTLLNAILGMTPLRAGQIRIHGLPVRQARGRLAYMPQREAVDWSFPVIVEDVVMMGRQTRLGLGRRPGANDRMVVVQALEEMQMLPLRDSPIGNLSGGQQQRVFLARALAQEGDVLLLDEPMTGVDAITQETILRLMREYQRDGRTMLMTTHDLGVARAYCSKVLFINRVAIAYGTPAQVFTPTVLERTYGGHVVRLGASGDGVDPHEDALLVVSDKAHPMVDSIQGKR
jgi:ABC-type Mn2+/Zn2+ transport system ATPase subunit